MSANQYTSDQTRAIEFFSDHPVKKHLVIEAGAGSGKTTILKERVKFLLLNKDFLPEDLIVITFTNNSTAELKHRISQLEGADNLSEKVKFIHISTMDSFFGSLVESLYPIWWDAHARLASKIPSKLSLLDEKHTFIELEQDLVDAMEHFPAEEMQEIADFILAGGLEKSENSQAKRSPLQSLLSAMLSDVFLSSDLNHIRISAQTIHPATQKLVEKCYEIARAAYQKRIEAGTMTYQDRNVFLKENLSLSCPLFFKELIVDEYQDTNRIQHSILWKLVELNNAQMTVVGDPKQSIYAFRGSNVDVFQSLLTDEKWNVISLDVNFRSIHKLLNEVNTLSHLSFDWQTSDLPELFKTSFFYNEAIKKSIGHKSLKAGVISAQNQQNTTIPTVTLFEYNAPQKLKNSKTPSSNKRDFNENNIKSLGQYLIAQTNENVFQWKDAAILCEKNKQITKIKQIFSELNIPCVSDTQHDKLNEMSFTEDIALSLFNILNDGIQEHSMDLFYVLISPLTPFSFDDVINYFLNSKNGTNENFNSILNILHKYHENFHHQFFIKWQNCRWELAYLCAKITKKSDPLVFCRQMDDFAQKIFSLSQTESIGSLKKILSQPESSRNKPASFNEVENAISIKTVHGAKGLEWDVVCFYPANLREPPELFSLSSSYPYLDINWLSEDTKSLSYLQKKENEKFNSIDNHYDEEKDKYIWFSDLRNRLEKNFERKRIFYTAFTRPRKKLIFVHPERRNAKSACQLDKKFDFSDYEKNFEQDIFLKYAYLTRENKTDAEHIRFSLEPDTPENATEKLNDTPTLTVHTESLKEIPDFTLQPEEKSTIQNEFSEQYQIITTPTSLIQQKQKRRKAAHHGILFHVKSENRLCAENSLSHLIHSHALQTWTEFEIWERQDMDSFHSDRKIIDILAFFHKPNFDKIFSTLSLSCPYLKWHVSNSSEYLFFIGDFKTGAVTHAGIKQIENYASLVEKLCASGWFAHILPQNTTVPKIAAALIK